MKLTWRLTVRISLIMAVILAAWAILFHRAILEEVNDETDDALELFSEKLISRVLQGDTLPTAANGTNNSYYIKPVTAEYAATNPRMRFSNESIFIATEEEDEPSRVLRTVFQRAEGDYMLLVVATPTLETEELLEAVTSWIIHLFSILLLSTVAVCLWVLRHSMRPLYRLLHWLEDNDISHKAKPLENPTTMSEFIRLNEAVLRYASRNEELYTQQKQFTGNASHEIQTPLAVCKNRLEMLAATQLDENQLGEVLKIQQTIEYISRLNRELLLLSKIDFRQFSDATPIDLAALIRKVAEDCGLVFAYRNIALQIELTTLSISMNETLATALVTNLVKNAYIHNCDNGVIRITQSLNELTISNTGDSSPLDPSQIFERFYQGKKRAGSTGLGLALAKAISNQYGFILSYDYHHKMHHFRIIFR